MPRISVVGFNGDLGNDMPAVLMALDASYQLTGADGERTVAARAIRNALNIATANFAPQAPPG